MKIAILDDYLHLSQKSADWSALAAQHEVTVFDRALTTADEVARELAPYDIICTIRERTPLNAASASPLVTTTWRKILPVPLASSVLVPLNPVSMRTGPFTPRPVATPTTHLSPPSRRRRVPPSADAPGI